MRISVVALVLFLCVPAIGQVPVGLTTHITIFVWNHTSRELTGSYAIKQPGDLASCTRFFERIAKKHQVFFKCEVVPDKTGWQYAALDFKFRDQEGGEASLALHFDGKRGRTFKCSAKGLKCDVDSTADFSHGTDLSKVYWNVRPL